MSVGRSSDLPLGGLTADHLTDWNTGPRLTPLGQEPDRRPATRPLRSSASNSSATTVLTARCPFSRQRATRLSPPSSGPPRTVAEFGLCGVGLSYEPVWLGTDHS